MNELMNGGHRPLSSTHRSHNNNIIARFVQLKGIMNAAAGCRKIAGNCVFRVLEVVASSLVYFENQFKRRLASKSSGVTANANSQTGQCIVVSPIKNLRCTDEMECILPARIGAGAEDVWMEEESGGQSETTVMQCIYMFVETEFTLSLGVSSMKRSKQATNHRRP